MPGRLLLIATLSLLVGAVSAALRSYRKGGFRAGDAGLEGLPALGSDVIAGAKRTWVVLSTPYCAACGPLAMRLRRLDPTARVVEISVSDRPDLASSYRVRAAPTLLLARADGRVESRLAGDAINEALSLLGK
ncbi:MAG: thioredoxin domain-containing protein [Acidimicrobiia bacterium]